MIGGPALLRRVDAHHHVWRVDRGDYGWLTPALSALYRDFTLDELKPLATDLTIDPMGSLMST